MTAIEKFITYATQWISMDIAMGGAPKLQTLNAIEETCNGMLALVDETTSEERKVLDQMVAAVQEARGAYVDTAK